MIIEFAKYVKPDIVGLIHDDTYWNGTHIIIGGSKRITVFYPHFKNCNSWYVNSDLKKDFNDETTLTKNYVNVKELYNINPVKCMEIVKKVMDFVNTISDDSIMQNIKIKKKLNEILKKWFLQEPKILINIETDKYNL